jgi:hypothetical protein
MTCLMFKGAETQQKLIVHTLEVHAQQATHSKVRFFL